MNDKNKTRKELQEFLKSSISSIEDAVISIDDARDHLHLEKTVDVERVYKLSTPFFARQLFTKKDTYALVTKESKALDNIYNELQRLKDSISQFAYS